MSDVPRSEPKTFAEAKRMLADCNRILGWHHGGPPPLDPERLVRAFSAVGYQLHENTWYVDDTDLSDLVKAYEDA